MNGSFAKILYLCLIPKIFLTVALQRPRLYSYPSKKHFRGQWRLMSPRNVRLQNNNIQRCGPTRLKCSFQAITPSPASHTHFIKSVFPTAKPIFHAIRQKKHQRHVNKRNLSLSMALLPIPRESLSEVITTNLPTPAQYTTYWGRTSREQYAFLFESFGVSFLGVFVCYFLSFAVGQFVATILGMVAAFWVLLGPELKAYQRNWELTGGRELVDPWNDDNDVDEEDKRGLYGAFYFGRISHVRVVDNPDSPPEEEYSLDEFEDYSMETDEMERMTGLPYKLRLRVTDQSSAENERQLQVHARMSEEYLNLEEGMPVCAVLLSTSQTFETLAGLTDFCVPDAGPCWVGDYPYLDRPVVEKILVGDTDLWETMREEGRGRWDVENLGDYLQDD